MRLSATLACHMRLERFPMDVQVREPIKIIHFMMFVSHLILLNLNVLQIRGGGGVFLTHE